MSEVQINIESIPPDIMRELARCVLKGAREFYKDFYKTPGNKEKFEEWQKDWQKRKEAVYARRQQDS